MANDKLTRLGGDIATTHPRNSKASDHNVVVDAKAERGLTFSHSETNGPGIISNPMAFIKRDFIERHWESHASEIFATKEDFELWLETPNESIEGSAPKKLLISQDGQNKVCQLLGRLEYGIMS